MRRLRRGFTLVELLIVIGIIVVLISILIPVVSGVRRSAQTAATQQRMTQISNAIHAYYLDFQAYPGAVPNSAWGVGTTPIDPKLTSSEDLTLALLGGLELDPATGKPVFNPIQDLKLVGRGPVSLNRLNPGQKNAYVPFRPEEISPYAELSGKIQFVPLRNQDHLTYVDDSAVPEFIDTFPQYRPILYLRANPGAPTAATNANTISKTYDPAKHYNMQSVAKYLKTGTDKLLADPTGDNFTRDYFAAPMTNTSSVNVVTAKYAGTYILISAGADGIFGTSDDVIVGGGGGQ